MVAVMTAEAEENHDSEFNQYSDSPDENKISAINRSPALVPADQVDGVEIDQYADQNLQDEYYQNSQEEFDAYAQDSYTEEDEGTYVD